MQGRLEVPPGVLELTPQLAEVLLSHEHILVWLFFFFFFFKCPHLWPMEVPEPGGESEPEL